MYVYITKYALTECIYKYKVYYPTPNIDKDEVAVLSGIEGRSWFKKPDWHESEPEALDQVETMRKNKIKSLEKLIEKYNNFDVNSIEVK